MGSDWRRRLTPAQQIDLEVSLLEAALRTAEGAEAERIKGQIAAYKRLQGGTMSKHRTNFEKAMHELADGLGPALADLRSFEAEVGEAEKRGTPFAPSYVSGSRSEVLARVRVGDQNAHAALKAYRETALADATALRLAAEAERDPAARMADEMERARLVRSNVSADVFASQAKVLLDGGQPQRAKLMLGVALDKGWRGGFEPDPETGKPVSQLQMIREGIESALDVAEPKRAEAKAIEDKVAESERAFREARVAMLAKHGAGEDQHGNVGLAASDRSRTSIAAKVAVYRRSTETGEPYRDPEGALASAPTGGSVRAKE